VLDDSGILRAREKGSERGSSAFAQPGGEKNVRPGGEEQRGEPLCSFLQEGKEHQGRQPLSSSTSLKTKIYNLF